MFKEFGVEPMIFGDYESARSLFQGLKADQGRLLAGFPLEWSRSVDQAIEAIRKIGPTRKKSLKEYAAQAFRHPYRNVSQSGSWSECVQFKCGGYPIHLAVTARSKAFGACLDDVLDGACELWKVPATKRVPRNIKDILGAIEDVLKLSNSIAIVDPYLNVRSGGRRKEFMDGFFGMLAGFPKIERCVLHSCDDLAPNVAAYLKRFGKLPNTTEVIWCEWPERSLHDRFLISKNVGAVRLGHGVDPARDLVAEPVAPTDLLEVSRVDADRWVELKEEYVAMRAASFVGKQAIVSSSS
ncbi:MAG: hypothetical protein ACT4PZ_13870 [Panacagrimonas sp.]